MMRSFFAAGLAVTLLMQPALAADFPAPVVENGRYLALAADCAACHTSPQGGAPFAGGYGIASPFGVIYSSNITPSKTDGIGNYSEALFARALRRGVRADGAHLYPAMPYTAYSALSDDDIHALYAYFITAVSPVDRAAPITELPFPFNLRISMAFWNALFLDDRRFMPDAAHDARWNRGAYLVGALEHCSACHTPRGFLEQELQRRAFAGAPLGEWYAPNITSDPVAGIGGWQQEEIVTYLRTGHIAGKAQAAGGMAEAVTNSLSQLTEADLQAMAVYLATIPAQTEQGAARPTFGWGAPMSSEASLRGADEKPLGASLYSGLCASCHGQAGAGTPDLIIPSLFHNTTVGDARPDNLVAAILEGVDRTADGRHVFMPRFGAGSYVQALSDAQVAAVATYVRTTFGPGGAITADEVAVQRSGGAPSPLLKLAQIGIAIGALVALAAFAWLGQRVSRRYRHGTPMVAHNVRDGS